MSIIDFFLRNNVIKKPRNFQSLPLGKDMVRKIKQGHRWLFADCFNQKNNLSPGLAVLSFKNMPLCIGIVQPDTTLFFRIICQLNPGDRPDKALDMYLHEAWARAVKARDMFPSNKTDAYRLIGGEGDGLPGLIIDIYRNVAVIKHDHDVMETIWHHDELIQLIKKDLPHINCVYLKRANSLEDKGQSLLGTLPHEVEFLENGALFRSNIRDSAKTGFFLDQRDNRLLIKSYAKNKNVLNLFSYTGGFSVFAGLGGAKSVTSVDIAAPAIKAAEINMQINKVGENHQAIACDAFEYLDQAQKEKKQWDIVITDPPSFAPNQKSLPKAIEAYTRVFISSLKLTKKGSLFAASSCSSHLTHEKFLEICQDSFSKSRRVATVLYQGGQPCDHPYPLAMSELRYLKFALFRVDLIS